eukprot:GHVH01003654.1.p1 GENE.GHVH01003654.1~~GHVH01003654.1.p1  ORF type:complete len:318 (-),score=35.04 GHVH01003654.1:951-1904(-)
MRCLGCEQFLVKLIECINNIECTNNENRGGVNVMVNLGSSCSADAAMGGALIQDRLRKFCGIPCTLLSASDPEHGLHLGCHLNGSPLLLIGFAADEGNTMATLTTRGADRIVFHLATNFESVVSTDISDRYFMISNESKRQQPLLSFPISTSLVGLCLDGLNFDMSGIGNWIAIAAASEFVSGNITRTWYIEIMNAIKEHSSISLACSDDLRIQSKYCDNIYPGEFFHCMSLKDNLRHSVIIQWSLQNISPEARLDEAKKIRADLYGCSNDEMDTPFEDLPMNKQRQLLNKQKNARLGNVDTQGPKVRYPVTRYQNW